MRDFHAERVKVYHQRVAKAEALARVAALPNATPADIRASEEAASWVQHSIARFEVLGQDVPEGAAQVAGPATAARTYSQSEVDAAVRQATNGLSDGADASEAPAPPPQISPEEAYAREVDAIAARISGNETLVAEGIKARSQPLVEAAPSPNDTAATVAARICAA